MTIARSQKMKKLPQEVIKQLLLITQYNKADGMLERDSFKH